MSADLAHAILGQLGRARRADDSLAITVGDGRYDRDWPARPAQTMW